MIDLAQAWVLANPLPTAGILCAMAVAIGIATIPRTRAPAPDQARAQLTTQAPPRC